MKENKMHVERFESIPSTNDYAKAKRIDGKNLVVVAKSQTGGRGTKGRSFSSDIGGLYISILRFYDDFLAKDAFQIMQNAAAAVCLTLEEFGLQPKIKWPNDILINGKKICGILIENTFSGDKIRSSIVGIGINVFNPLEDELKDIATSILLETGKKFTVEEVEEKLLKHIESATTWLKYPQYVAFIGEEVTLLCGDKKLRVKVQGVDKEGNLLGLTSEGLQKFPSAEVSLRGDI